MVAVIVCWVKNFEVKQWCVTSHRLHLLVIRQSISPTVMEPVGLFSHPSLRKLGMTHGI